MAIRFHLDESIDPVIADALRRHGIEVSSAREVGLLGASDEVQLAFAVAESRTLVTHDGDFAKLHSSRAGHAGVVIIRQGRYAIGELVRIVTLVHGCLSAEEMRDHIEFF